MTSTDTIMQNTYLIDMKTLYLLPLAAGLMLMVLSWRWLFWFAAGCVVGLAIVKATIL